jgi:tetratricopeptide (TPR) repeat protein
MLRITIFTILAFFFSLDAVTAQQKVGVRLGEHDAYSRIVFDLGKTLPYKVDTATPGRLVIAFEEALTLAGTPAKSEGLRNLSGFEILSAVPLRIGLDIPKDSRARHFTAGDRLIVDVYNSPSGLRQAAAPPAPKKEPVKQPPPQKEPAPAKEVAAKQPPPPAPVREPETEPAKQEPAKQEPEKQEPEKQEPAKEEPVETQAPPPDTAALEQPPEVPAEEPAEEIVGANLVTLTATTAVGMAVFHAGDTLWLVHDKEDLLLSPQIAGPQARQIGPLKQLQVTKGKAYEAHVLPGLHVRGQGGGLLWRIILSPEKKTRHDTRPVRKDVIENGHKITKILWPFKEAGAVIDIPDPATGTVVKAVTVKNSKEYAGAPYKFIEFETLDSPVGLAVLPKVDDLDVRVTAEGVEISRPGGLAVSPGTQIDAAFAALEEAQKQSPGAASNADERRVFTFRDWLMGGIPALDRNKSIILADLKNMPQSRRVEEIVTLAKMYLANGHGEEALGFLRMAQDELPGLAENPQFLALRGAAALLAGKSERAFFDLSLDELKPFTEMGYWRAAALADLGDWAQAEDVMPAAFDILYTYPNFVFNRLGPVLAEVLLRAGNADAGGEVLEQLKAREQDMLPPQKAALAYLQGEAARQRGDIDETKKLWEPLTRGSDDLYRAKAGLALTRLLVDQQEIAGDKAVDHLERLRYAWRGDDLEAQINYWLGKTYFENGEYVKGLNILREAASLSSETDLGRRITAEMSQVFTELFLGDKLDKLTPLDATALYEQFAELVPAGEQGDKMVEKLAEHLVQADLLDRAAGLLAHQIEHRIEGPDRYRVGVRLTGIYLLNKDPARALDALKTAEAAYLAQPAEQQTPARLQEIYLLRAHALAMQDRPAQALELLAAMEATPDVNKLKADVAWNAGYWDDAAEFLEQVIYDRNPSLTRPLEAPDAALILNRAVALSLSNNRVGLANMREKYSDAMAQTEKAKIFEVITRPRQSAALADRETLMGIVSEVDLFGNFLENYRAAATPPTN